MRNGRLTLKRYNIQMLPSHDYLKHLNIHFTTASFPPSTPKGAANVAGVIGVRAHQAVKTLIFKTDDSEYVLIMVSADLNAISGHLKKVVGSRNVQLASPEEVIKVTGYQIGSIPPFSWQPAEFRSFLDHDLIKEEILAVKAEADRRDLQIGLIVVTDQESLASDEIMPNLLERLKSLEPAAKAAGIEAVTFAPRTEKYYPSGLNHGQGR